MDTTNLPIKKSFNISVQENKIIERAAAFYKHTLFGLALRQIIHDWDEAHPPTPPNNGHKAAKNTGQDKPL
jgi:hypothetical protein